MPPHIKLNISLITFSLSMFFSFLYQYSNILLLAQILPEVSFTCPKIYPIISKSISIDLAYLSTNNTFTCSLHVPMRHLSVPFCVHLISLSINLIFTFLVAGFTFFHIIPFCFATLHLFIHHFTLPLYALPRAGK